MKQEARDLQRVNPISCRINRLPISRSNLQTRETVSRGKSVLVFFSDHPPYTLPRPLKSQMLQFRLRFCFHLSVLTTTKITPTVCPQRTTSGQCCIIPFTYKGVTYNSCTDADHHRLWCSLDSQYKGRWDNCRKYNLMTPRGTITKSKVYFEDQCFE